MCGARNQRFLLLFGTQKGQAQAIAEEIGQQAEGHGFLADIFSLQDMSSFSLETERDPVIIVISTTGTGDPPEPAVKFVRTIQDKDLPADHLCHLRYGLLALGDSEYTYFCNGGKVVDRRLQELGAKRFYDTGYADDCVGLELTVEPWIDGLWGALRSESASRLENQTGAKPVPINKGDAINLAVQSLSLKDSASDVIGSQNIDNQVTAVDQNVQSSAVNMDPDIQLLTLKGATAENQTVKADTTAPATIIIKQSASGNLKSENLNNATPESDNPSLVHSVPPLSQSSLTVPSLPPPYLDVYIHDSVGKEPDLFSLYPGKEVFQVPISQSKCLTAKGSLKTALLLELDVAHTDIDFQPGDAFCIICPNPLEEVVDLIDKLGLTSNRGCQVSLSVRSGTKKRGASVPDFIPKECSLQFMLTWCLEIRATPKKAFLRALVEFTSDGAEKRRLQELCSKQGGADYNLFVRDPSLNVLHLLKAFPSCRPPLSLLIEHLPKLQARSYSAANSSLFLPGKLCIVFNIVEFPPRPEIPMPRRGVCTGWLDDLVRSPRTEPQICILGRPSTAFHLPSDTSVPVVMVGPGTGIAPFIGFLQHREKLHQQNKEWVFGETWLFFGCRSYDKDYLFQDELSVFVENGTLTHLNVCFSREAPRGTEESRPKYVQDCLKSCSKDIVRLLTKENGCLYVCGDAKNMAKDVNDALVHIFSTELCVDKLEAMKVIASLRDHKQYLQDIWS